MDLLQKIYEAGVVGAGGAGFPTHIKLKAKVKNFIINAAECEPLLQTDKLLMRTRAKEIIWAAEEIGKALGNPHITIAIKSKYVQEIESLQNAIGGMNSKIKLFFLENYYPAGDEQMMVYEVIKASIPEAGIPLDVNAVVSNVGTLDNVYDALHGEPVIHKYVSVIGEVNKPTFVKAPIGTSISQCIDAAEGSTAKEYAVVIGGPMMGEVIDAEEIQNYALKKTTSSIIVLPKEHYIVQRKRKSLQHIINESKTACIQCRYCTDLCHRHLLGHKLRPHLIMRNVGLGYADTEVMKEALLCCECGICEIYSCPMGLSPRMVNGYIKKQFVEKGIKPTKGSLNLLSEEMLEYRKIPTSRLMSRLDLTKYAHQHPSEVNEINPPSVFISLSQHIGKPAQAVVKEGDFVKAGQLIGRVDIQHMGANVHASIDGQVCEISGGIAIKRISNEVIS